MKKEIAKMFGDALIKKAEYPNECALIVFHEVERPECLKKLDRDRAKELELDK